MFYRDTTFCTAACGNEQCSLKFTPAVTEAAQKWWGREDAPVAVGDRSQGCLEYQPKEAGRDERG